MKSTTTRQRKTAVTAAVITIVAAGGVTALALGAGVATGAVAFVEELLTHQKEEHFADRTAFSDNSLTMANPDWLPADATDITFRIRTDGPGNVIRLTSSTGPDGCTAVPRTVSSDLTPVRWLPEQGKRGWDCGGDWWVQRDGTALVGWTNALGR